MKNLRWSPTRSCIPSKPVTLILISTIIIGMIYTGLNYTILVSTRHVQFMVSEGHAYGYHVIIMILLNLVLALFGLFYPLSGFIGDIYTGRFRIITFGFEAIWIASFIVVIYTVFEITRLYEAGDIVGSFVSLYL